MSFQPGPGEPMGYPGSRNRLPGGWSPGRFLPAILAVAVVVVVVVAGAIVISRRGNSSEATPTARPSGQPITIPSSAASSAGTSAPSAASSAAPGSAAASASAAAASTAPRVFLVANTDGDGVYLRRTPSMNDRDTAYPDDTELVAIGPDVTAEGEVWHHVRTPDGKEGYVPAKYTVAKP